MGAINEDRWLFPDQVQATGPPRRRDAASNRLQGDRETGSAEVHQGSDREGDILHLKGAEQRRSDINLPEGPANPYVLASPVAPSAFRADVPIDDSQRRVQLAAPSLDHGEGGLRHGHRP